MNVRNLPKEEYYRFKTVANKWMEELNDTDFGMKIDFESAYEDATGDNNTILVLECEGEIVGFIVLSIITNCLTGSDYALEKHWYVIPEYRHGVFGAKLFKEAKKWARQKNCGHLIATASNIAGDKYSKVCRFYKSMKMKLCESVYICEV